MQDKLDLEERGLTAYQGIVIALVGGLVFWCALLAVGLVALGQVGR